MRAKANTCIVFLLVVGVWVWGAFFIVDSRNMEALDSLKAIRFASTGLIQDGEKPTKTAIDTREGKRLNLYNGKAFYSIGGYLYVVDPNQEDPQYGGPKRQCVDFVRGLVSGLPAAPEWKSSGNNDWSTIPSGTVIAEFAAGIDRYANTHVAIFDRFFDGKLFVYHQNWTNKRFEYSTISNYSRYFAIHNPVAPVPPSSPVKTFSIIITSDPQGIFGESKEEGIESGSNRTLFPKTVPGFTFRYWTVNGERNTANPLSIMVDRDYRIHAVYSFEERVPTESVFVRGSPHGIVMLRVDEDGSWADFHVSNKTPNSPIRLEAGARANYQWDGWYVNDTLFSVNNPLDFVVSRSIEITARFSVLHTPELPPSEPSSRSPSDDEVLVFQGYDFTGPFSRLTKGGYPNSASIGLPNDSISSVRVGKNVRAVAYMNDGFDGDRLVLPSDEDIRAGLWEYPRLMNVFDNQISSIMVIAIDGSIHEKPARDSPTLPFHFDPIRKSWNINESNLTFPISIHEYGTLSVQIECSDTLRLYLSLLDVDGRSQIHEDHNLQRTSRIERDDLAPGTYYVRLDYAQGRGSFALSAQFNPLSKSGDHEPNDHFWQAQSISLDQPVVGLLGYGNAWFRDHTDWFKVTIPKEGTLRVRVDCDDGLRVSLYLFDVNASWSHVEDSSMQHTARVERDDLGAGTYYFQVSLAEGYGSYTLRASFEPVPVEGDHEPNDHFWQAQSISLDQPVVGLLGYGNAWFRDHTDWFKVIIPQSGTLSVSVDCDEELRVFLTLYDKDARWHHVEDSSMERTVRIEQGDLEPGTYYIQVSLAEGYGSYTLRPRFVPRRTGNR